ncbi:ATP-binding protein [Yinghuangia aomiensis]
MRTMPATPSCRFEIPPEYAAVPHARRTAHQVAAQWGLPPDHDRADTLRVIVSELVTNAVKHAGMLSPVSTSSCGSTNSATSASASTTATPSAPRRSSNRSTTTAAEDCTS